MKFKKLIWLGVGAAAGSYLVRRNRRNRSAPPPELTDHRGERLEPWTVELAGGETIDVVSAGEGPPLLLVPGLSGDKEVFRYQLSELSARFRVIAPDLRVRFENVDRDFDQFAHDLTTVLNACGVSSTIVLGLSFGGPIAMRFARLYPERLKALIVTNTLARLSLDHVGLNKTLLIPLAHLSSRYLPEGVMRRVANFWGRQGVWVYEPSPENERVVDYELESAARIPVSHGTSRMDTFKGVDLRDELPRIDKPALVIRGAADTYCLQEWQREIARLLPNARYVEIPDAGHLALISHAETFNRVVVDWVQEVSAAIGLPPGSKPAESA